MKKEMSLENLIRRLRPAPAVHGSLALRVAHRFGQNSRRLERTRLAHVPRLGDRVRSALGGIEPPLDRRLDRRKILVLERAPVGKYLELHVRLVNDAAYGLVGAVLVELRSGKRLFPAQLLGLFAHAVRSEPHRMAHIARLALQHRRNLAVERLFIRLELPPRLELGPEQIVEPLAHRLRRFPDHLRPDELAHDLRFTDEPAHRRDLVEPLQGVHDGLASARIRDTPRKRGIDILQGLALVLDIDERMFRLYIQLQVVLLHPALTRHLHHEKRERKRVVEIRPDLRRLFNDLFRRNLAAGEIARVRLDILAVVYILVPDALFGAFPVRLALRRLLLGLRLGSFGYRLHKRAYLGLHFLNRLIGRKRILGNALAHVRGIFADCGGVPFAVSRFRQDLQILVLLDVQQGSGEIHAETAFDIAVHHACLNLQRITHKPLLSLGNLAPNARLGLRLEHAQTPAAPRFARHLLPEHAAHRLGQVLENERVAHATVDIATNQFGKRPRLAQNALRFKRNFGRIPVGMDRLNLALHFVDRGRAVRDLVRLAERHLRRNRRRKKLLVRHPREIGICERH